jgi:RimJ/RimL family protein N-acetyltransferase
MEVEIKDLRQYPDLIKDVIKLLREGLPGHTPPFTEEQLLNETTSSNCRWIIAIYGSEIVGVLGAEWSAEIGYLKDIVVKESMRGKGIGTLLTLNQLSFLEKLGIKEVVVYVLKDSISAVKILEKLGFKKVGELPEHHVPNKPVYIMKKRIS